MRLFTIAAFLNPEERFVNAAITIVAFVNSISKCGYGK